MRKKNRIYYQVMKTTWRMSLDFRTSFLLNFVCNIIPVVALFFLWKAIYKTSQNIGGFSLKEMLTYLIVARIFFNLIVPEFFWDMSEEIKSGEITVFLSKPINYMKYWFFKALSTKIMSGITLIIPILFIFLLMKNLLILDYSPSRVIFSIIALGLSYFLYFEIFLSCGLLSFWFFEVSSFFYTMYMVIEFFSGSIIPINLLPEYIQNILIYLPFKYLIFFPMEILLKELPQNQIIKGFIIQVLWILILNLVIKVMWKRGLKKFQAYGG